MPTGDKINWINLISQYKTKTRNRAGLAEDLNKEGMIEPNLKPLTKQKE